MKSSLTTLNEALTYHLEGLYDAEKKLQKSMPRCFDCIEDPALKRELQAYTESAVDKRLKLKRIFSYLLTGPFHRKNRVIDQLLDDTRTMLKCPASGPLRDAMLIACIQHINHYKIAGYGTALGFATALRLDTVVLLLHEMLEWEKETDRILTKLAVQEINRKELPEKHLECL